MMPYTLGGTEETLILPSQIRESGIPKKERNPGPPQADPSSSLELISGKRFPAVPSAIH